MNDQFRVELEGFLTAPPGLKGKNHAHPFWELIFINQGEGKVRYGSREKDYRSHDLYLFRPFEEHQFANTGERDTEHLYLGFSFQMNPPVKMDSNLDSCLSGQPEVELIVKELRETAAMLKEGDQGKQMNYCRQRVMGIILNVMKFLYREAKPVRDISAYRNQIIVDRAKEYLSANQHRNVTVQELAGLFYISPSYFGEIFKKVTGSSIKSYHNTIKMNSAITMLKQSSLQIQEIASKLGFESIHYFSRKFKEYFKVPPTEYRQKAE